MKKYLCGHGKCCPSIEFKEEKVIITDDDNNQVTMTKEEFEELKKQ